LNPYAAPKAKLEEAIAAGNVWREGNLVRIERSGALPERCIVCNRPAAKRITRNLYWSSRAWRSGAALTPFVILALGIATESIGLLVLFWPSVIVLFVANFFIRKKFQLALALCERHRRLRTVLQVLSVGAIGAVGIVFYTWDGSYSPTLAFAAVTALVVLAVVQSFIGVHAVSVKRLSDQHAWLGGTGRPFREALPELPG
jgi:hypothetical protein